jgi:hypothetical protein
LLHSFPTRRSSDLPIFSYQHMIASGFKHIMINAPERGVILNDQYLPLASSSHSSTS